MARSKGIVKLKGKIGNLSFYKRMGVDVVRESGGPSSRQIKKRKSMRRNRENINEFYHAASPACKTLRDGLRYMKHLWHCDLSGHLTALMRRIIEFGPGAPGERSLNILLGKSLLKDYRFHPERSWENIFVASYNVQVNTFRNEATFTVPSFNAGRFVNPPEGATHFRLLLGIVVVSEYVFAGNAKPYTPADVKANGKNDFVASDFIEVKAVTVPLVLHSALQDGIVPAATSAVVVAIGIEFYQEVNGTMYRLKQVGCMKVEEVV